MKPNWSALEALLRTLLILGASTFVGALVLPVAADGTLPVTWAAWKPVLAVGASAAVVAEMVWIRSHLAALAAAAGLPVPAPAPANDATKAAQRGVAELGVLLKLLVALALLGVCSVCALRDPSSVPALAGAFLVGLAVLHVGRIARCVRWALVGLVALLLPACVQPATPAQQAQDAEAAVSCVEQHWGESIGQLAGDCLGGLEAAAEDIVADVEAMLEAQAILKTGDATAVQQAFPYASSTSIVAKVKVKRAALLTKGGAR